MDHCDTSNAGWQNLGRRKDKRPPATQDMLFIRGLTESGVAILADGTLSRLIEVEPIDMTMKDPSERERIYAWYTDWIRNLRHPTAIQIVIASTPQDISPWLEQLRQKRNDWEMLAEASRLEDDPQNEMAARRMATALANQVSFIENAHARTRPLVDRYFVTVFYNPFPMRGKRRTLDPATYQQAEEELDRRVRRVADGLARVAEGQVTILDAHQVAAVVGDFYHRPSGRGSRYWTQGSANRSHLSPIESCESPHLQLAPSLAAGLQMDQQPGKQPTGYAGELMPCDATQTAGDDWT
ncbi:MAG: hypothetical protein JXQ27_14460 [Acidobacteria bacterium]|nr:hypothetical protein [Acidobacteriota bacterium]